MRWVIAVLTAFVLFGACGEEDLEFPGDSPDPTTTAEATSTPGTTETPDDTPTPTVPPT